MTVRRQGRQARVRASKVSPANTNRSGLPQHGGFSLVLRPAEGGCGLPTNQVAPVGCPSKKINKSNDR